MPVDFEAEGLLDGLDDPQAREARLKLLRELSDAGVGLQELKAAAQEDRLLNLPLEFVFTRGLRYTLSDMIAELGFEEGFVRRNYLALGLPLPAFDEPALDEEDMESWRMLKLLFDAGFSEEQILQLARPSGRWAAQIVDLLRQVFVETFFEPGDTERDFGLRPLRLHLREQVRRDVIGFTEVASGGLPDTREIGVCFADLVAFTRLSEQAAFEELGDIAARLEALAGDAAEPPVRLIKLIGDAAMLVSPDVPALVTAAWGMVAAAEKDDTLPRLRVGMAAGQALNRGGDWYGPPVNLASRVTDVAEPGTVVASDAVAEATTESHRWDPLGARRLRGIAETVPLCQLRSE